MSTSHTPNPRLLLLALALTATSSTLLATARDEGDPHYLPLIPSVKCSKSVRLLLSRCLVQTLHLQTPHSHSPLGTRCCIALKVATKRCQKDEPLGINIPAFRILSTFCESPSTVPAPSSTGIVRPLTAGSVEPPASSPSTSLSASAATTPPLSPAAAPGGISLAAAPAGEGTGATPPAASTSLKTGSEILPVPSSSQSPSPEPHRYFYNV